MTSTSSFKQFSLENDMEDVTPDTASMDSIYKHNTEEQRNLLAAKPWSSESIPPISTPFLLVVPITSKRSVFQPSHSLKWSLSTPDTLWLVFVLSDVDW